MNVDRLWKQPDRNWRVLAEIFNLFDKLQGNLLDQKSQLRFLDNIEICLNMHVYLASKTIEELMELVLENFMGCLLWLTQNEAGDLAEKFKVQAVTIDLVQFVMNAFLTLLRDRPFGYSFCPDKFLHRVPPAQVVSQLVTIGKNEHSRFSKKMCMTAMEILDGMTCLDLIKEFKDLSDKKSPYFKEICKYFNIYAQTLRTLAKVQTQNIPDLPS